MPDLFVGRQLGDYRVEERIGRGASAAVYRACQVSLQRYVALKIIDVQSAAADEAFQRRFAQEAEVIAALEHIHILPIYDYALIGDNFAYIVMRLLSGGSLADLIQRGPIPQRRTAVILMQIARGLAYAHSKGVIHRDLKPSNILFDDAGNVFLTDFGLAKYVNRIDEFTEPGNVVGTPAYVAPEALRGDPVDYRADIYGLGVLTYQMLAGRLPFEAADGNLISLIHKHLEEEPPKLRALDPTISPELEAVVLRALRKDPDERFQSAEELAEAFSIAAGRRAAAQFPIPLPAPSLRLLAFARQTRARMAGLVLILALLVGGLLLAQRPFATARAPVLLTGVTGKLEDSVPSEDELAWARARLGDSGFIAFVSCTMDSEFQATRAREMGDFAAAYGLAYRVYDSQDDGARQVEQIARARLDGAQAIIVCPLDPEALIPALESLRQANIPVVTTTMFPPGYGVRLDVDSYQIGLAIGRFAGQIIQDEQGGNAAVVILSFLDAATADREADGIEAGLRETAAEAQIVGRFSGSTRESARQSIAGLLSAGLHFDVVASVTDVAAFGAIDALEAAGYPPDSVAIVSANAEALALEYVREGYFMRGTVYLNREAGSRIALNAAARMLAGATLPETFLIPPGEMMTREHLMDVTG